MHRDKFKQAIFEALSSEYERSVPPFDKHEFSPEFEKKMKKLINRRKKPYYIIINTIGKRAACIVIGIIIASSITVMSVDAIRNAFVDLWVNIFEKFSIVKSIDDNNAPETIEDIYEITYDLSDYTYDLWYSDEYSRNAEYIKENIVIHFNQDTKSNYDILLNTEDVRFETIIINGYEAMYFQDNHNYNTLIWDNDDYIISLYSNISKSSLIDIAKSVQKVE